MVELGMRNPEKEYTVTKIRKRLEAFLERERFGKEALEHRREERSERLKKAKKVLEKKGVSALKKIKVNFPGDVNQIDVDWDGKGAFINITRPGISDIFYRVWTDVMYDEIAIRSEMDYGPRSGSETLIFRGLLENFHDVEKIVLEDFMEKYEGFLNK